MSIVKAEVIKTRKPHDKTKYKIILIKKIGFWKFSLLKRCELNWLFETYEMAYKWVKRMYPQVKTITINQQNKRRG